MLNDLLDKQEIYQEIYRAGRTSDSDDTFPPYSGLEAEYRSDGFEDAREDLKQEEKRMIEITEQLIEIGKK